MIYPVVGSSDEIMNAIMAVQTCVSSVFDLDCADALTAFWNLTLFFSCIMRMNGKSSKCLNVFLNSLKNGSFC